MPAPQRSSADFYSAVPNPGAESYPPSRSYANAPIPGSTEELSSRSPPPPFANDHGAYPTRRSDSHQSMASQYSYGGQSTSPRPHSGAWGGADSYDATPQGSSANLNPAQRGYSDKEYAGSGLAAGAGGTAGLSSLNKGGSGKGGQGGWWSRKSSRAKKLILFGLLAAIIVIAVAVAVPAAVMNNGKDKSNAVSEANDGTQEGIPTGATAENIDWRTAAYGGNGSTVYMENGESFMYNNSYGESTLLCLFRFAFLTRLEFDCRWLLGQHSLQRYG